MEKTTLAIIFLVLTAAVCFLFLLAFYDALPFQETLNLYFGR